MKFALYAAVACAALSFAVPASASIVFDFNTGLLVVDGNTTVGDSVTISFNGHEPNEAAIPGLTADLTLTFQGLDGNNYLFDYLLANTSTSPVDAARVTAFGFTSVDPNPDIGDSSVNGGYDTVSAGNFPGGSDLEFCAKNGQDNNCAGSQGGPGVGESVDGDLIIAFADPADFITLGGLAIRWQGIEGDGLPGSAIGEPTPPGVPEPATWATMLLGFGAAGYALRRRRKALLTQVA